MDDTPQETRVRQRHLFGVASCLVAVLIPLAIAGCTKHQAVADSSSLTDDEACRIIEAALVDIEEESDEQGYSIVSSQTLSPQFIHGEISEVSDDPTMSKSSPFFASSGLASLLKENQIRRELPRKLDESPSYRLVSKAELDRVFRHCFHGWRRFFARYPGAVCYLRVSWPGVSPSGLKAAVFVDWAIEDCVGGGTFMLLEKRNGEWQVVDSVGGFVS